MCPLYLPILREAIFILLPAWVANMCFTFLGYFTRKFHLKDYAFDFGINFVDGKRFIGDSVTWFGLLVGVVSGGFVGLAQGRSVVIGILIGCTAFFGDAIGSFIKRRFNIPRGGFFPILDHSDYVLFTLLVLNWIDPIRPIVMATGLGLTLLAHPIVCIIGYYLKLKTVPW